MHRLVMLNEDMRILVVEDDNKIASFIAKGLKQGGYAVDRCADGEEALVIAGRLFFQVREDSHHRKVDRRGPERRRTVRGVRGVMRQASVGQLLDYLRAAEKLLSILLRDHARGVQLHVWPDELVRDEAGDYPLNAAALLLRHSVTAPFMRLRNVIIV